MITYNIYDAKTHLSQLIAKALEGEEVIIAKSGKQLVRLQPIETSTLRTSGQWKGKVSVVEDFDTLPEEVMSYFNGKE